MSFLQFLLDRNFNIYDIILFILIFQSVIFCVLLSIRSDYQLSHKFLASFIASLGLGQFAFLCLYNPTFSRFFDSKLNDVGLSCLTLVFFAQGFLLYLYVSVLSSGVFKASWKLAKPAIIFILAVALVPWLWGTYFELLFWRPFVFVSIVGFATSAYYGLKAIRYIYDYSDALKDRFANLEHMDIFWLKSFSLGFVITWFLQFVPPFFYFWSPWWVQQIVMHAAVFISLLMMNLVFFGGLLRAHSIKQVQMDSPEVAEQAKELEKFDTEKIEQLKIEIEEKVQRETLYKRKNLNIERMAAVLELPERQLSHIINRGFGQNYFEFINHYRLEEAKRLLESPEWDDKNIQEIYEEVGFSSRSTFFTLFRKANGITPLKFRENQMRTRPA